MNGYKNRTMIITINIIRTSAITAPNPNLEYHCDNDLDLNAPIPSKKITKRSVFITPFNICKIGNVVRHIIIIILLYYYVCIIVSVQ